MSENIRLPRAGATLTAKFHESIAGRDYPAFPFVVDEHDDFWSVCAARHEALIPVQRHTSDGWVAAIFHRGYGYLKIVAPGETLPLPRGQFVIARIHRQGVRWEFPEDLAARVKESQRHQAVPSHQE